MSTTATDIRIPILDGGSKFELFAQLADIGRFNNVADRPAFPMTISQPRFKGSLAPRYAADLRINGISAESGSGESWMIDGFFTHRYVGSEAWFSSLFGSRSGFRGLYNTRTRTGYLELT